MGGGVFSIVVVLVLGWLTFGQREGTKVDRDALQLFCAALGIAVTTWFVILLGGRNIGVVVQYTLRGLHAGVAVALCIAALASFTAFASSPGNVHNHFLAAIKSARGNLVFTFPWGAALGVAIGCIVGFAQRSSSQEHAAWRQGPQHPYPARGHDDDEKQTLEVLSTQVSRQSGPQPWRRRSWRRRRRPVGGLPAG
jgi:hypothetical protein